MPTVYRIEHRETGEGPYASGVRHRYDEAHRCRNRRHSIGDLPGPGSLGESGTPLQRLFDTDSGCHFVFGFDSPKQLKRWFRSKRGRRALVEEGMTLATFEVPETAIARGNWQVAFLRSQAHRLGDLDLVEVR